MEIPWMREYITWDDFEEGTQNYSGSFRSLLFIHPFSALLPGNGFFVILLPSAAVDGGEYCRLRLSVEHLQAPR
jgi:hypothetical protein